MPHVFSYISYRGTGRFSKLVSDYSEGKVDSKFYAYSPDPQGIADAIASRSVTPVNRQVLHDTISRQYEGLELSERLAANITALAASTTFTITTAHQPNLMTGYLYFVHKILHAIKLADELNAQYPGKHFVPVYYMGSEDADLDELGTFRFRGDQYRWDGGGQKGAVGRMDTASLRKLLDEVFRFFGPPGPDADALKEVIQKAYLGHKTVGAATRYLVNFLFGRYGLVVLDPDDAAFKALYVPVMEDELLNGIAHNIITEQTARLNESYQAQMFPRPINLFYLESQLRERIEKQGDKWQVLNTSISFTKDELLAELHAHPERFSPNVALRGMFQETILPDVAFIGGGAEVAYWLQLLPLFRHYGVFYPPVLLRQSVLWVPADMARLRNSVSLDLVDMFTPLQELLKQYILAHSGDTLSLKPEIEKMEALMQRFADRAAEVDATLKSAAAAASQKMRNQAVALQKKMLRAQKRKMNVQVDRITRLWEGLNPNGNLQERTDNFLEYYLEHGHNFFDVILQAIKPLTTEFLIVEEK
ncbi:MAG: bacillithiol biosynthesis cysteine-adding enzyme BshC [Taibaiella sp.]|nr:bacillithiol biosynthesis cysteine-adding enzyme BshC [Taibaiella sp.]